MCYITYPLIGPPYHDERKRKESANQGAHEREVQPLVKAVALLEAGSGTDFGNKGRAGGCSLDSKSSQSHGLQPNAESRPVME